MRLTKKEAMTNLEKIIDLHKMAYENDKTVDLSLIIETLETCLHLLSTDSDTKEQVICCKDCRYWQDNNGGYPHPDCRWAPDETPEEDDYCSYAERMEEAQK